LPNSPGLNDGLRKLLAGMSADEVDGTDLRQRRSFTRRYFFVEGENRDGTPGLVHKGGVFLHDPTVALLLPSDFPPLSRRRPDFAGLRHVLVRFSFMLDRLPPRHAYESARLLVTLDDPSATVRAQRPSWVTADAESSDRVTTEFSAALDGMVRLGADRSRVTETRHLSRLPVITAENRGRAGFGWTYRAQDGAPLLPRVEFALAVVELAGSRRELSGSLSAEAVITEPRFGVLRSTRAAPSEPPVPFRVPLSDPGAPVP
jgi:hypothetical protein